MHMKDALIDDYKFISIAYIVVLQVLGMLFPGITFAVVFSAGMSILLRLIFIGMLIFLAVLIHRTYKKMRLHRASKNDTAQ